MRHYPANSPEAMARILAMFMVTDGNMDPREIDSLEKTHAYDHIGITRKEFARVLSEYCDDISDEADEHDGTIHLLDRARIDALLEEITDQGKRVLVCALAMDVAKSDGEISDPEIALMRHVMKSWNVALDDIEAKYLKG